MCNVVWILSCCFRGSCRLCCSGVPACTTSLSARITYLVYLVIGIIVTCIFMAPAVTESLSKFESFCKSASLYIPTQPVSKCNDITAGVKNVVGFPAVYRMCFGMSLFFFGFVILMIKVKSSNDYRAYIQNGFWFFKFIILVGLIVGSFFIHAPNFEFGFMIIGAIGSFLFYIIQMVLIVDFAYGWTINWVQRYENTDQKFWFYGIIAFSFLFYFMFIGVCVVLFIFYAAGDCDLHKFFISFNLILCVIVSVISVLPKVKKYNPHSGLLQSSVVSLYTMYITWTSMASSPTCNPLSKCLQMPDGSNSTTVNLETCTFETFSYDVIVPLVILLFCILYAGISDASSDAIDTVRGISTRADAVVSDSEQTKDSEKGGQKVVDDEKEGCKYNYSFFHFMFLLSVLFLMMTLTHWFTPNAPSMHTVPAVWVKIASSWMNLLIYLWILLAPIILRNREFT
ncbi:hypothetical protein HELRODRAFT_176657 [Helobdella robusta]|uniref:Serine incorporator 5 n=1 Tax=Helobdella robusta TaxID=6412 RepID=T1FAR9_HELRO|nr:hypothetical protein HELRODRAFT_176657 [Helobdella robusta]ESN99496.1 hypothetical protein HELRODRAFT_176657 [Helobdella robusta]